MSSASQHPHDRATEGRTPEGHATEGQVNGRRGRSWRTPPWLTGSWFTRFARRGAAAQERGISAGVALALFLAALTLRLEVTAWPDAPFATFLPAVAATAWLCGRWPAVTVGLASAAAAWLLLLHVPGTTLLPAGGDARALGGFLAAAMLAAALAGGPRRERADPPRVIEGEAEARPAAAVQRSSDRSDQPR